MVKKEKGAGLIGKILNFIILIILLICLYWAYQFYQTNNLNDFMRAESKPYTSEFSRDLENKYGNQKSYVIESNQYNDAMIFQKIKVNTNMPYKVTCMVKTENVQPENDEAGIGAQISITGSTERSVAITGTNGWQKIELIFNSKNRQEVEVAFRLGGNSGECTGTAWFADLKIEEGIREENQNWKFACFIFRTTDVIMENEEIKLNVTDSDVANMRSTISRFETACSQLSNQKMTADCDIYEIQEPITELSYSEEFGYYVGPEDIEKQIKQTISENDYDHIFAIVRLRRRTTSR